MADSHRIHSWRFWIAWLIGSELAVLILPTWLIYDAPIWSAQRSQVAIGLAAVQLATVLVVVGMAVRTGKLLATRVAAVAMTLLGALYLLLLITRTTDYSRGVLVIGSLLIVALSEFPVLWMRARRTSLVLGASVLLAVSALPMQWGGNALEELADLVAPEVEDAPRHYSRTVPAAFYVLQAEFYEGLLPTTGVTGGALDTVGDQIIVITGDGELYRVGFPSGDGSPTVTDLELRAPLNRETFASANPPQVSTVWFQTADVLAEKTDNGFRLLVSHHFWKTDDECFVLRVSELDVAELGPAHGTDSSQWRTLYETEPCLKLKRWKRGHLFGGLESGGRLARMGADRYLLTVGDHEFDGWNSEKIFPQAETGSYGKTVLLHRRGEPEVFTKGHRNPQGLHIARDGRIWLTEHGPEGGDELNLLLQHGNYGWPFVTMGTQYGGHEWPLTDTTRGVFTRPVFGWTPAIGISNLITVQDTLFGRWRDDLLIASLRARTMFRARVREERVINVEPLEIGARIRDIEEGPHGRIVLLLDSETLVFLSPANLADDGEAIFAAQCEGCHQSQPGPSSAIGPNLEDIYMRRIAWREDFGYSEALDSLSATAGGVWNEETLDEFLENPQGFAPGTSMEWPGLADARTRQSLIKYLITL